MMTVDVPMPAMPAVALGLVTLAIVALVRPAMMTSVATMQQHLQDLARLRLGGRAADKSERSRQNKQNS
jgi:hypothetical protein